MTKTKFTDSMFREPSYHQPEAAMKRPKRQKQVIHPRSINLGPHTILTIYPDSTAGGQKLIQLPPEAIDRFAAEQLELFCGKVAFLEQWLALPKRQFEPYT